MWPAIRDEVLSQACPVRPSNQVRQYPFLSTPPHPSWPLPVHERMGELAPVEGAVMHASGLWDVKFSLCFGRLRIAPSATWGGQLRMTK
jgi:hypothetical protein